MDNGGPRKGPSAESVRDEPPENWKKRVSRVTIDSFVYGNRDSGHPPELIQHDAVNLQPSTVAII